MNVLFTKMLDEEPIRKRLGSNLRLSFMEVIKINILDCRPFPLGCCSLIFTSVNGVEAFFKNGFHPNENLKAKNFNKIYCVGKKTKLALAKHGFGVFKLKKNAAELTEFIINNCAEEKFIHFCGDLALDLLQNNLSLQNIDYKKIIVYRTDLLYPKVENNFDAVVFFSPSGVRSFMKNNSIENKSVFSIGETTALEIRKYTNQKIFIGQENNLDGILELIKKEIH